MHALLLFLFTQLHVRQQARPDAMDVWPSQAQQEEKASRSAPPGAVPLHSHHAARQASSRLEWMPAWQRSRVHRAAPCCRAAIVAVWGKMYHRLPALHQSRPQSAHHYGAEQPPQSRLAECEEASLRAFLMEMAEPVLLWPCSAQLIQPHQQAQTQMQAPTWAVP